MIKKIIPFFLLVFSTALSYELPLINLGSTSFLDGGGGVPVKPGIYWHQYNEYYQSNKFKDGHGHTFLKKRFSAALTLTQLIYVFEKSCFLNAYPAITGILPYVFNFDLEKNHLHLKESGAGFGDFLIGPILAWDPIMYCGRPLFQCFMEADFIFPTGKNHEPKYAINPGNHFFRFNPFWAATLFFTEKLSTSWRLHYLWNAKDTRTHIKAGDAVHLNYTLQYQTLDNLWVGINGYYLQQLKDSKLRGHAIPNSKERIFAIGPGCLYGYSDSLFFYTNLYFESLARNRTEGILCVFRFAKAF